jgi:hypothetical protein
MNSQGTFSKVFSGFTIGSILDFRLDLRELTNALLLIETLGGVLRSEVLGGLCNFREEAAGRQFNDRVAEDPLAIPR